MRIDISRRIDDVDIEVQLHRKMHSQKPHIPVARLDVGSFMRLIPKLGEIGGDYGAVEIMSALEAIE